MRIRHVFRPIIHFLLMVILTVIPLIRTQFKYYLLQETNDQSAKFLKVKARRPSQETKQITL
jgi:heme/copper-type cytochrome/quinol oxidase subunit 4